MRRANINETPPILQKLGLWRSDDGMKGKYRAYRAYEVPGVGWKAESVACTNESHGHDRLESLALHRFKTHSDPSNKERDKEALMWQLGAQMEFNSKR